MRAHKCCGNISPSGIQGTRITLMHLQCIHQCIVKIKKNISCTKEKDKYETGNWCSSNCTGGLLLLQGSCNLYPESSGGSVCKFLMSFSFKLFSVFLKFMVQFISFSKGNRQWLLYFECTYLLTHFIDFIYWDCFGLFQYWVHFFGDEFIGDVYHLLGGNVGEIIVKYRHVFEIMRFWKLFFLLKSSNIAPF